MRVDINAKTISLSKEDLSDKTNREIIGELVGEATVAWDKIPEGVFDTTKAQLIVEKLEALVMKEKNRVLEILLKETPWAVERYGAHVKRTGGLLSASMKIAYEKGLRDAIKIIAKEGQI